MYTRNDRFVRSVLETTQRVHEAACGSGEYLSQEEERELVPWLYWRVTGGWFEDDRPYDNAVRLLALEAVSEWVETKHYTQEDLALLGYGT